MKVIKVGICFSKELQGITPLSHIVTKLPVYLRFLDLIKKEGWVPFVLTRKTYKGNGIFDGGWLYQNNKFSIVSNEIKIDLVYDRTGGVVFPIANDNLKVVNERAFKLLACDKFATYKAIGEYMPKTLLIENREQLPKVLSQIKSDMVVLKPFNGLKGIGIFIGNKKDALNFEFDKKYNRYIAQEFIDTSDGITNLTSGRHDLRIVIVNGKPVWCHVRVPAEGSLLANAAQGGNLTEVDCDIVPKVVKDVVDAISTKFSKEYDNPIYSLDFGVGVNGRPYVFEINDQMGFPKWGMDRMNTFLEGLIANFKAKLSD